MFQSLFSLLSIAIQAFKPLQGFDFHFQSYFHIGIHVNVK